jgi:DNA-directed RNA polymerase beta subunit
MRQLLRKLVKEIRRLSVFESAFRDRGGTATSELYQIDEHRKIIKSSTIESGMKSALMTGNWGSNGATQGVSQVLNRSPTVRRFPTFAEYPRISTRTAN